MHPRRILLALTVISGFFQTIKIQQQRLTDLKKTLQRELKVQSMPNDDQPLSDSESVRAPSRSLAEARSNSAASLHHSASSLHPPQNFPRVTPSSLMNSTEATLMGSMGMPLKANNNHHQPFNSHGEYDLSLDVNLEYLKHVVLKFVLSRETEVCEIFSCGLRILWLQCVPLFLQV